MQQTLAKTEDGKLGSSRHRRSSLSWRSRRQGSSHGLMRRYPGALPRRRQASSSFGVAAPPTERAGAGAVDRASSLPAPHPVVRASSSCPAPPWPQPGRVRRAAVGKGLCGSRLGWEAIDRSSKQRLGRSPVFVWRQTPEV